MTREPILYLDDMISHAREAHRFVACMTLDAFAADTRSQYAVKYALHVVGEAAGKVPPAIRARFPHVAWRQIVAMRNRLAHDYLGTRLDIVFATARDFAPLLVAQPESIIAELEIELEALGEPRPHRLSTAGYG